MTHPRDSALRKRDRRAFTLLELIVVIAIMGVMALAGAVALNRAPMPRSISPVAARIAAARRRALETGQPVQIELRDSSGVRHDVLARPDGVVLADPSLGIDPFTGRPDALGP